KPDYFKKMGIKPTSAAQLLEALDVPKIIESLINDRNPAIRLQTLNMLYNRAYGLPKETGELNVGVAGGVTKFVIEYASPNVNDGRPLPLAEFNKAREQAGLLEGETVTPREPASSSAAVQPPPPLPEPTGTCRFHGDYLLKDSGGREICPQCRKDSERYE